MKNNLPGSIPGLQDPDFNFICANKFQDNVKSFHKMFCLWYILNEKWILTLTLTNKQRKLFLGKKLKRQADFSESGVETCSFEKYFGHIMDNQLKFDEHIQKKISKWK